MSEYRKFVEQKINLAPKSGFDIDPSEVSQIAKPHQRAAIVWAIAGGRRALFESFGLGKTLQELEISRIILTRVTHGKALIVCPLGVKQEFKRDGEMLGIKTTFIRSTDEASEPGIYITNYESVREGKVDPRVFDCVCLDEAAVLRSYGSKTFQTFMPLFSGVPYRFVATATPSPNRFKELIHYAGFLGIMDTGQALTRFFKRDSTKANNLTLYPHKEQEFWCWLASWALFLQKPSDLGFSDAGYAFPEMKVHYHELHLARENAGFDSWGQGRLLPDSSLSLSETARAKRDSLQERVAKMREILDRDPSSHYIIWHDLEDERHAIKKAVPEAVSIYGSQDLELRTQAIIDFSDGAFKYLSAKPSIAGAGCNFQRHCHKAIFLGIGFKFHEFIQAVHRVQRFLQTETVEIHIIHTSEERDVLQVLQQKWTQHNVMTENMSDLIREHGLSDPDLGASLRRTIGVNRREQSGEGWTVVNNDTVIETANMEENSVGLVVTSIPFANHYEYTPSYEDFGHTQDNAHFWAQMDFLTPNIKRVLQPGRIYACHVKDRILFGNQYGTGAPTVSPFHAEALFHGIKHGFYYMGMITVVTDVVRENNQTYRLGWSENCKDGSKMGVGSPEYILLFRKPQTDRTKGYADIPVEKSKSGKTTYRCTSCGLPAPTIAHFANYGETVTYLCQKCGCTTEPETVVDTSGYSRARWQTDAHAMWRSSGERPVSTEELAAMEPSELAKAFTNSTLNRIYSHEDHVRIGESLEARGVLPATFMAIAPGSHHPDVWHDVNRMGTLNTEQARKGQEAHVCPLQFDIVNRLIDRYSNPGELVYDPFGGLCTVPYCAVKKGRKGRSTELNAQYFDDGVKYMRSIAEANRQMSLPL